VAERLQAGDGAPPFRLPAHDGRSVALADYAGRALVLFIYPAAGTPGCTGEVADFVTAEADLAAAGYALAGLSPDPPARLADFAAELAVTFPLLSDPGLDVVRAYGAWGERVLYGKHVVGLLRSTIVVGPDATVQLARYNVRASGHVASLRRALGLG